jgi:uncharacterized protein (TIGR03437 family)
MPALAGTPLKTLPGQLANPNHGAQKLLSGTPLYFEPGNNGGYVARVPGYRLSLRQSGLDLIWDGAAKRGGGLHMRLACANAGAQMEGVDPLPSHTSYFLGADVARWRTGVPNYGRVRWRNVYKGVDLVLYGSEKSLEFDFDVAPGASPSAIRMDVSGSARTRIVDGALVLETGGGEVRWSRPAIYQTVAGVRRSVPGHFVLEGRGCVGFEVGAYDRALPLVIDPVVVFSTYFGSANNEAGHGIALDGAGNIYIAGYSSSDNLPVSVNAVQPAYGGNTAAFQTGDGFVAKFSPSGSLLAMTYLGGAKDDFATALAVDSAGNVYVTGYTNSTDFPVTANAYQKHMAGEGGNTLFTFGDAFITKLNSSLSQMVYSTYLGGTQDEGAGAIAIDSSGNAYVAGITLSLDFPVTAGVFQRGFHGSGGQPNTDYGVPAFITGDAFITKLSADGSQLVFSTYLGGSLDDAATAIAVDSGGNVYVAGYTISTDFPTTAHALQRVYAGAEVQNEFYNLGDAFIAKLNPTGTALLYSTYLGGEGDDAVSAIAVDSAGNLYATGATTSTNFPVTAGAFQTKYAGPAIDLYAERIVGDAFVVKLKPDGTGLVYSTYLGGSMDDHATAIAIDAGGNVFVGGDTASMDLPITSNATQKTNGGGGGEHSDGDTMGDGFLAVLNPTATSEIFATYLGGIMDDAVEGLAIDAADNICVTGVTMSANFPVTSGAFQSKYGGNSMVGRIYGDAFLAKFSAPSFGSPVVFQVQNAESGATTLAPNTWVSIFGSGLAPDSRVWQTSDFLNNLLPTALDGVSVTMNGLPAYVYYISATQINVLTPPNLAAGAVQVVVTSGGIASSAFTATTKTISPSFFIFGGGPYVAAVHPSGSFEYIGPTTLYPGASSPAAPGETIEVFANGFGVTDVAVTAGSETQSGSLQPLPVVTIGGVEATVTFAGLISPGLYQFNVVVPNSLPAGDAPISATYNGATTQSGMLITIQ